MKLKPGIVAAIVALIWFLAGSLYGQAGTPQEAAKDSGPAPATATPAATAGLVPSRPRFIPVLISVTSAGGGPIAGLTKEQLTLIDTNQSVQPLQLLNGHDIPLHLGVVLVSATGSFSQQQAAAANLVQKVILSLIHI